MTAAGSFAEELGGGWSCSMSGVITAPESYASPAYMKIKAPPHTAVVVLVETYLSTDELIISIDRARSHALSFDPKTRVKRM